jgi:hypothetical protein
MQSFISWFPANYLREKIEVSHTTNYGWIFEYTPILEPQIIKHLKIANDSRRLDETYIKVSLKMVLPLACGKIIKQHIFGWLLFKSISKASRELQNFEQVFRKVKKFLLLINDELLISNELKNGSIWIIVPHLLIII